MMRGRQRGVAVITALLIVALAITISAGISTELQLEVRRTGNMISYDQSLFYVKPAEKLAMSVLKQDAKDNRIDHLDEGWAQDIPPLPLDGGSITGKITDLHGCFNINNVNPNFASGNLNQNVNQEQVDQATQAAEAAGSDAAKTSNQTAIERLKRLISQPAFSIQPQAVDAVVDWIDSDLNTTVPGGAEDGYYLYQDPPYRTGNQSLKSISTLRLIKGFEDPKRVDALLPFVCAVDGKTDINVNTAPIEVLLSLDNDISESDANAVIQTRQAQPFQKIEDFLAVNDLNKTITSEEGLDVASEYFLLTSNIEIGNARRTVYSVIHRQNDGKTRVVSRMQNSL